MPKSKKRKAESKDNEEYEEEPGIVALFYRPKDLDGQQYFETLRSIPLPCFLCQSSLSPNGCKCNKCDREFYLCDDCKGNQPYLFPELGKCVYCVRHRNQMLKKIVEHLCNKANIRLSPLSASDKKKQKHTMQQRATLDHYIDQLEQLL